MMEALGKWLLSVSAAALLVSVVQTLIPEGGMRRAAVFTGGLLLLAVLLRPVVEVDLSSISESLENSYDFDSGVFEERNFDNSLSARLTASIKIADYLEISQVLSPTYAYSLEENDQKSNKETDFLLKNSLTVSIPYIGITYKLANTLYEYSKTDKNGSIEKKESVFPFDKSHVSAHSISLSKQLKTEAGTFTPKLTYTIWPLTGSFTPELSYSFSPFSIAASYKFADDGNGRYKGDLAKLSLGYNGTNFVTSWAFEYQSADFVSSDFFLPLSFTGQVGLRTADKKYSISGIIDYSVMSGDVRNNFDSLKAVLSIPYLNFSLDFAGPAEKIELDTINAHISIKNALIRAWKGRIYISLGLDTELELDVNDIGASSFTIEPSIIFSIAEFLDFRFSFSTVNNNFSDYEKDGSFSFSLLWQDLMRSLDFFGDGRRNTNFNLSYVSLEAVHYMQDWNLHCKYSASVVLSDSKYQFVPQFSIYLSWNTFPDLKIDEKWKRSGDSWIRSDTN